MALQEWATELFIGDNTLTTSERYDEGPEYSETSDLQGDHNRDAHHKPPSHIWGDR
jgi:hypothetical protein